MDERWKSADNSDYVRMEMTNVCVCAFCRASRQGLNGERIAYSIVTVHQGLIPSPRLLVKSLVVCASLQLHSDRKFRHGWQTFLDSISCDNGDCPLSI